MRAVNKIEIFFNMHFNEVISKLHWDEGRSLLSLSNDCKVSRDVFQKECKKRNIPLRNRKQASKNKYENGFEHWANGKNKFNSDIFRAHSKRMTDKNPSRNIASRKKMSKTLSKLFKNNPLPQEEAVIEVLNSLDVEYIFQHPVGSYILDFFFPVKGLCLEIDSTYKWDKAKRVNAIKRDIFLLESHNIKTIRVNKVFVNELLIIDILKTENIIID